MSGRKARMEVPAAGFTLDLLPSVLADGFSVDLSVDFALAPSAKEANATAGTEPGRPLRVSTKVVIWDGQTMVIGNLFPQTRPAAAKRKKAREVLPGNSCSSSPPPLLTRRAIAFTPIPRKVTYRPTNRTGGFRPPEFQPRSEFHRVPKRRESLRTGKRVSLLESLV